MNKKRIVENILFPQLPLIISITIVFSISSSRLLAQTSIDVVWQDLQGVSVNNATKTISKTAGNGWGNSGAASSNQLPANENGLVSYTVDNTSGQRALGFSSTNRDEHYTSIEYGFYFNSGVLSIMESGNTVFNYGSYLAEDILEIKRIGSEIKYYVNNSNIHTSTTEPETGLLVDIALNDNGASFSDIQVDFGVKSVKLTTVEEGEVTYQLSGGQVSETFQTGSLEYLWVEWPETDELITIGIDVLDEEQLDMGIDLAFEIDNEGTIKHFRVITNEVGNNVYHFENGQFFAISGDRIETYRTFASILDLLQDEFLCASNDWNYVYSKSFNGSGIAVSESVVYSNRLGSPVQTQIKDISRNDALVSQNIMDEFGRGVWNSLVVPKYKAGLCYKDNFVVNPSGATYTYQDFDGLTTLNAPLAVGSSAGKGSLGWYYDDQNTEESHVPDNGFPFIRTEYYPDPLNRTKRATNVGQQHQLGSGHEQKTFYLDHAGELTYVYGAKTSHIEGHNQNISASKTITIDAHGLEQINYSDDAGLLIATCLQWFIIQLPFPEGC